MTKTITNFTREPAQPVSVGGLRVLGRRGIHRLDVATIGARKRPIRIGRSWGCDIRIDHGTVSAVHCEIFAREGALVLRDCGAKNGITVSTRGPHGLFMPVAEAPLEVGMHIRLGRPTLVAVDHRGASPLVVWGYPDLIERAYALYGSVMATARYVGRSRSAITRMLARPRGAEPREESRP